ncbi:MAG: hypothetical protein PHX08_09195 [Lachnospiraceae bacterium]|nr:hypothetical protein [Lachnospiraceae bacterium]
MIVTVVDIFGKIVDSIVMLLIIDLLVRFSLCEKQKRKNRFGKILCIACSSTLFLARTMTRSNILIMIITTVVEVVVYCIYILAQKRVNLLKVLSFVFTADILASICGVVSAGLAYLTVNVGESSSFYPFALVVMYLYTILPFMIIYWIERRFHISTLMEHKTMQYAVVTLGMMSTIIVIPMRVKHLQNNVTMMYLLVIALCMFFSWSILWTISQYFSEQEKAKILADNRNLSAKLHRTKEFFPALVQTIQKLQTQGDVEPLKPLIEEMQELCEIEIKERKNEDMEEKLYMSTGVQILDELIAAYGKEAARKDITFDMYIGTSVDKALKEKNVSAIDFVRTVGDLTRNAFRAIERGKKQEGAILLTMGDVDDIFELDVYDNGVPFSTEVLEKLGEKGNTEGGTGYGLADVLNCLEGYQCSFKIEEFDQEDEFTKGISIFWDRKNARMIETDRNLDLSDTCILKKI